MTSYRYELAVNGLKVRCWFNISSHPHKSCGNFVLYSTNKKLPRSKNWINPSSLWSFELQDEYGEGATSQNMIKYKIQDGNDGVRSWLQQQCEILSLWGTAGNAVLMTLFWTKISIFAFTFFLQEKSDVRHQITNWINSQELLLFEERNMPWTMRRCCWGAVLSGTQSGALDLLFMLVGKKTDMCIAEPSSTSMGIAVELMGIHHTQHAQRNQVFSSL